MRLIHYITVLLFSIFLLVVLGWSGTKQVSAATSINVTTTADVLNNDGQCTLREAIRLADGYTSDPACGTDEGAPFTILLQSGETYKLSIAGTNEDAAATGDMDILANVTIQSTGDGSATVDGGGIDRVFHVAQGAALKLNQITVTGGLAHGETPSGGGGGILNDGGTVSITDSSVSDNFTDIGGVGGGIHNRNGVLTIITV